MINNKATSFGGAFTSFAGSNLYFTLSEFSDNVSGFYGGGILALYGNATVTYSKINRNRWEQNLPIVTSYHIVKSQKGYPSCKNLESSRVPCMKFRSYILNATDCITAGLQRESRKFSLALTNDQTSF